MKNLLSLLSGNQVFSYLNDAQRARVAKSSQIRRYRKGETIALLGEVWPYFFLVGEGRVHAVKESSEGRRLTVTDLGPGDMLWGMAIFLEGVGLPVMLTASEDCCIYLWRRENLVPVFTENGRALWELASLMVFRMQFASDLVDSLAFQSVTGRVARMVLDLFGDADDTPVARDMTLDQMAAMVGTTREVMCRTLYRLAEDEIIQITRTEFILADKNSLEELAEQQ
jgi:CRP-like cAMP-binding protein